MSPCGGTVIGKSSRTPLVDLISLTPPRSNAGWLFYICDLTQSLRALERAIMVNTPKFDQSWIAKYTQVPGNAPWWEKLQGEDRKNAEAWIAANAEIFKQVFGKPAGV